MYLSQIVLYKTISAVSDLPLLNGMLRHSLATLEEE